MRRCAPCLRSSSSSATTNACSRNRERHSTSG
jgi:hypothetical protein